MRNITDIYKEYKIMPNLAEHQLRVASVSCIICESLDKDIDKDSVVTACLLHDMGNIIKFKIDHFPEFLEPEGLAYWVDVQREYIKKYGDDEHKATIDIAQEIGISEAVFNIINSVGFSKAKKNFDTEEYSKKIAAYADMRVKPDGVCSLEDRLSDLRERYMNKKSINQTNSSSTKIHIADENEELRKIFESSLREIEKQIFMHCKLKPEEITDESIAPYMEKLKNFEI